MSFPPLFNQKSRYLSIFLAAVILDIIIHIFAIRHNRALAVDFSGLGSGLGSNSDGWTLFDLSSLIGYYKALSRIGPQWLDLPTIKSFFYGAIIAGCIGIILLILSDVLTRYIL